MPRSFVVLAILFGMAALVLPGEARAQAYDYCSVFKGGERIAIVLDRSAAYTEADVARLRRGVAALRQRLEARIRDKENFKGFSVEIRPVTSYTSTSGPVFQECAPACPTDIPIWDSCKEQEVARDRKAFWARFDQIFAPAQLTLSQISQGETPLAEVIEKTVREVAPTTLVVFSDFLEHHAAGNHLPKVSFYSQNSAEMSAYLTALKRANVLPELRSVAVVGYGFGQEIGGKSRLQRTALTEGQWRNIYRFWISYFQEGGANGFSLESEYPGVTPPQEPPPPPPQDRRPLN